MARFNARLRSRIGMRRPGAAAQRGVYAIEFAFVFLLFFALLYAILCWGILMTLRVGLQNAAEDGARAALRFQYVASGASQMPLRRAKAAEVAGLRVAGWFATAPVVVAEICQPQTGACGTPACGVLWAQRCQIVVTVTASGLSRMLPLVQFALPDVLVGKASMLLDGRAP